MSNEEDREPREEDREEERDREVILFSLHNSNLA